MTGRLGMQGRGKALRWDHAGCVWGQKGVTGRQGWGRRRSGQIGRGGAGRARSKP